MRRFISFLLPKKLGKEKEAVSLPTFMPDKDVEALGDDESLFFTRQLMTLARRRRCAVNHMGELDPFLERGLDWKVKRWYLGNGYSENNVEQALQSDLIAVLEDSAQISKALKRRIILTDYFTGGWGQEPLKDEYGYGDINPFQFESRGTVVDFRDTLFDKMSFPERVDTIISFDPEIRGHRHQIRYFRGLQVAYSLAHLVSQKSEGGVQQAVDLLLEDELALARGWITTANRIDRPKDLWALLPDESLLYSQDKVYESAHLLYRYSDSSEKLFTEI